MAVRTEEIGGFSLSIPASQVTFSARYASAKLHLFNHIHEKPLTGSDS